MLTSIFQWLTQAIGESLDGFVKVFLGCLNMSLSAYLDAFPVLEQIYMTLRTVGIGLTLLIATVGLFNFFFLKAADLRYADRPFSIGLKAMVAAGLTYYGGYILEYVVKLSTWSFGMFNSIAADQGTAPLSLATLFTAETLKNTLVGFVDNLPDIALVTISLVLVAMVAYNILKLVLEVVERYLMVGVLVYTSPLAYCTMASPNTMPIFKRWVSMVISSCIMMSVSVIFLKLIVNGLYRINQTQNAYWMQMLLVLAMCKIAQRADSYLNQLGLTTAQTGGGLLEDLAGMAAMARTAGGMINKARGIGSRNSVLDPAKGGNGGGGQVPHIRSTGPISGLVNGFNQMRSAFVNGASIGESMKQGGQVWMETMKHTAVGGAVAGAVNARHEGRSVIGGAASGAVHGAGERIGQTFAPNAMNAHRAAKAENERVASEERQLVGEQQTIDNAAAKAEADARMTISAHQPLSDDVKEKLDNGKPISNSEADANFAASGIAKEGESAFNYSGAKSELCDEARAAGLSIEDDGSNNMYVNGREEQVGALLANEFNNVQAIDPINGVLSDAEYRDKAIDQLAANPAEAGLDAETFNNDYNTMPKEDFQAKYSSVIESKAGELKQQQIDSNVETNNLHSQMLENTAANSSPNASLHAFFDNGGTMGGNPNADGNGFTSDSLGNAMMEKAFSTIASDRAAGTTFSNVRARDREAGYNEVTGEKLYGGRVVEATYTDKNNQTQSVKIYDHTAYTSMTEQDRKALHSYTASDGRQLWTTANIQPSSGSPNPSGPKTYAEPIVMSTAGNRRKPNQPKQTNTRQPNTRAEKTNHNIPTQKKKK